MIVLDTHIWVWWVHGDAQLPAAYQAYIQANEAQGLGVSCPLVTLDQLIRAYPHVRTAP